MRPLCAAVGGYESGQIVAGCPAGSDKTHRIENHGSTGHNAISFLSRPHIAFHCSLLSPSLACTRSGGLIAVRATFICLIQYFVRYLRPLPVRFRGTRSKKNQSDEEVRGAGGRAGG